MVWSCWLFEGFLCLHLQDEIIVESAAMCSSRRHVTCRKEWAFVTSTELFQWILLAVRWTMWLNARNSFQTACISSVVVPVCVIFGVGGRNTKLQNPSLLDVCTTLLVYGFLGVEYWHKRRTNVSRYRHELHDLILVYATGKMFLLRQLIDAGVMSHRKWVSGTYSDCGVWRWPWTWSELEKADCLLWPVCIFQLEYIRLKCSVFFYV